MDLSKQLSCEEKHIYICSMKPILNKRALYSDGTKNFCFPEETKENDEVTIRIRTAKDNADFVWIDIDGEKKRMEKAFEENAFDYYEIKLIVGRNTIHYYFEIQTGNQKCYYTKLGVQSELQKHFAFDICPGFHTPEWAKGAVMYQIFVDRFCNGDDTNDLEDREYFYIGDYAKKVKDWNAYPSAMDVRSFYGGDLQGVMDKLDYLQNLGVDVIYLNPIFVSPSNHKYDAQDYDYIDPHYGKIVKDGGEVLQENDTNNAHATKYIQRVTSRENLEASNEFFAQLVSEIHKRGMKIILDGVFNHCGSFNKWMDRERIYENQEEYEKGAYVSADSPYRSFFKFYNENQWPYNGNYDGWWGHDTLPKLNYEDSPELYNYIMRIAKKWLSPPYNIDGWRLDVAADLGHSSDYNHQFWRDFRKVIKETNPEALILAEHYGNPRDWLRGDQWDSIMNYDAFMEPITWFLTGMEKHSDSFNEGLLGNADSFANAMRYNMAEIMMPSLFVAMNELSNHDHSRFLTRTNHKVGRVQTLGAEAANQNVNKAVFRVAVVMQMTWWGAPTIYYGDEVGVCGFTDPDNRRTYPWGKEDFELLEFHKEIIRIHKENKVLLCGSLKIMNTAYQVLSYGRFDENEQVIVALNNGTEETTLKIPVWECNVPLECELEQLMLTAERYYSIGVLSHPVKGGWLTLTLPGTSAIVLRHRKGQEAAKKEAEEIVQEQQ